MLCEVGRSRAAPTSPNCRERSTSTTRSGWLSASAAATFRAMTVLPTPPLPATTAVTSPRVGAPDHRRRGGPVRRRRGWQHRGDRGRRRRDHAPLLEGVDTSHGGDQVVALEGLLQELTRAGEHGQAVGVVLGLHRHHDHAGAGKRLHEHLGGLTAVHAGETGVHDGDVRLQPERLLHRRLAVTRRTTHLEVVLEGEATRDVVGHLPALIRDQNANHRHVSRTNIVPPSLAANLCGDGHGPVALIGRAGRNGRGSTGVPLARTSKWQCGPVELPVEPSSPMGCPAFTTSPGFTSIASRCP